MRLDKTVNVTNVSSFSLAQWMAEFERLKKVNGEIMGGGKGWEARAKKKAVQEQAVKMITEK